MVKVDKKLILKVAENARLNLSEEELEEFTPQLEEILAAFSELDSVDVSGEKPSFHPLPVKNVARQDKVEKCLSQEEALKNAKNKKEGYFLGPRVV